jgi:CBS domain-containing protein
VSEIMTPVEDLRILSTRDKASDALNLLAEGGVNQLPVVEDGRVLGLVTREDIIKWWSLGPGKG